ncbi:MAG: hypothetical protein IJN79_00970 [Clostridia bacterium]|nr:hypothetical protein [Clostridia bacterium]MBQ2949125.1 hypothetical protein [Clostridia bacterium]MBQ6858425.1 hypothetical protein [Clostridia bacterium]MBQ7051358.1 hypothetical protein [Clostridia bacterium]
MGRNEAWYDDQYARYEGTMRIPVPLGVYQAAGDTNVSPEYAYRAENMRTERGLLASAYGTSRAFPALGAPVETLTRFYRRSRPDDPDVFVAGAGGKLYTYTMGTEGWVERASGLLCNVWSCATYEAVEDGETVDVLILSNAQDGMIAIYGSDLRAEKQTISMGDGYENVKFAVLSRHAERIWGTGAPGYPDSVFYSKPYDPFDFSPVQETPEMGGGVINQPTWDGDAFTALCPFGGYLLAVKPNTVFEIRGTDPSSFTITEAYGTDGPAQARTICVDRLRMLYLAGSGLGLYDGASLSLLSRDALHETMRLRMEGTEKLATACVCNHVYYLALCVRESEGDVLSENNTVIEFDMERGTFMIRKGIRVKDFFAIGGKVFYTQADSPYEILRYGDAASGSYLGEPIHTLWETPWMDLEKGYVKRDFLLRFTADSDENDTALRVTIETDRRRKTKTIRLGRQRRDHRVRLQASGLRARLRIESSTRALWRIYGGVQMDYTLDEE